MENGAFRSGVAHCYALSFAVKANITVIRGNCGRTKQGAGQRGATRWRHLFAASQTVNFPGTSDCLASNTQSEIAQQRGPQPSFSPTIAFRSIPGRRRRRVAGQSRLLSSLLLLSFLRGGCGLMTYQTGK